MAKQSVIDGLAMSPAEEALYDWDLINLTPIVFQTSGGRSISCDNGDGQCVYIENAHPSIYLVEGLVSYKVVFHDPVEQRLGAATYEQSRDMGLSFFIQVIAPFVEPEE